MLKFHVPQNAQQKSKLHVCAQMVELEEGRGDWDRSWEEGESYHQVKVWQILHVSSNYYLLCEYKVGGG